MKYLYVFILLIGSLLVKAQTAADKKNTTDSIITYLKSKKEATDKYLEKHSRQMLVLVKVSGKQGPVHVYNGKWPDKVEYTLNILKNKDGNVVFISQSPFSESGDWDISYEHYFDEAGKVFAFYKNVSVFDDNVKGGIVRDNLLKYYDKNFKIIYQKTWLTNAKGYVITGDRNNFNFRNYKYSIYHNLDECLRDCNIKL